MNAVVVNANPEPLDSLSLLALKIAPNVFDLSSGQFHASIRDQVVRAQLLIRDLCSAHDGFRNLLVVGAGVAGVSAALAAAARGKRVRLVDAEAVPFALQRGIGNRYVGPFMYEWPSGFHDDQQYPPNDPQVWGQPVDFTPQWTSGTPIPSSQLAKDLSSWFAQSLNHPDVGGLECWLSVNRQDIAKFTVRFARRTADNLRRREAGLPQKPKLRLRVNHYRPWPGGIVLPHQTFAPDYILLAAGMGREDVTLPAPDDPARPVKGLPFWAKDDLRDPATCDKRVAVFGGGDGALQDVLRALTQFDHPLDMLTFLRSVPAVSTALDARKDDLLAIEAQGRLLATWTLGQTSYEVLDRACEHVAEALAAQQAVRDRVFAGIRRGTGCVLHFVREPWFTKAYLLNRFMVHLIRACIAESGGGGMPAGCMGYECHRAVDVRSSGHGTVLHKYPFFVRIAATGAPQGAATTYYEFDTPVIRFGMVRGSAPALRMINLSWEDDGRRTAISHVPMPFVVAR